MIHVSIDIIDVSQEPCQHGMESRNAGGYGPLATTNPTKITSELASAARRPYPEMFSTKAQD